MFNFFLIVTGILANGYILTIEKNLYVLSAGIGMLGVIISAGFFALDIRNTQLVKMGEEVLREIEEAVLFPNDYKSGGDHGGHQLGFLYREAVEKEDRENKRRKKWEDSKGKKELDILEASNFGPFSTFPYNFGPFPWRSTLINKKPGRLILLRWWVSENKVKHKVWIRAIEGLVAVGFLVAAITATFYPEALAAPKPGG